MNARPSGMLRALIGCLTLLSGNALRADSGDLDDVLHALAARRHGEVSFIEQHFLSMLKRPVESSGELIYDAPDHLEKRTLEPRPESLVLQGQVLTVQRGRSTHVLDLKSYPQVLPLIESIRATLAGDRAALEQRFKLDFGGDRARWILVLTPLDAQVAKAVSRVQIDGARGDLLRVEIQQPDGDRSLMTLRPHASS
jgi:outer membrane lipoprotein carrier protein LolA